MLLQLTQSFSFLNLSFTVYKHTWELQTDLKYPDLIVIPEYRIYDKLRVWVYVCVRVCVYVRVCVL